MEKLTSSHCPPPLPPSSSPFFSSSFPPPPSCDQVFLLPSSSSFKIALGLLWAGLKLANLLTQLLKRWSYRAGEMARWFRALASFQDLGSVPSTHGSSRPSETPAPETPTPSTNLPMHQAGMQVVHRHTYGQNTRSHRIIFKKFQSFKRLLLVCSA